MYTVPYSVFGIKGNEKASTVSFFLDRNKQLLAEDAVCMETVHGDRKQTLATTAVYSSGSCGFHSTMAEVVMALQYQGNCFYLSWIGTQKITMQAVWAIL